MGGAGTPHRPSRQRVETRGYAMIIEIINIVGTVFGCLVTVTLLMVCVDGRRADRRQPNDVDDNIVL